MTTFNDLTTLLTSTPNPKKIQSYVVDMTPDGAARALGDNFQNNRKLRQPNVTRFADALSGGYFVAGSTIRFTINDGKLTLVDGQHRLSAIAQSDCDKVPLTVVVSPGDAAKEYALIDTIQMARSSTDSLIALDGDAKSYPRATLGAYAAAINIIARNFEAKPKHAVSRLETAKVFDTFKPEIAQCEKVLGSVAPMPGTTTRGIFKASVLSVVLVTAKYTTKEKWTEFWLPVRTDDGLRVGDPRKRLHMVLSQPTPGGTIGVRRLINASIKLWNAYQEGRELQKLYLDGEMEKIVGTPYPM